MRLRAALESWLAAGYPVTSRMVEGDGTLDERSDRAGLRAPVLFGLLVVLVGLKAACRDLGEHSDNA